MNRDPIEEKGGINLYLFVDNNPTDSIDIKGLWSSDVHYGYTKSWALSLQYAEDSAVAIAQADEDVDKGATSFVPISGDQRYHFNRNGSGKDSRMMLYEEHFRRAKEACSDNDQEDPKTAAKELGTALHPYQDWVAHGDYGKYDEGHVFTIHNQYSPEKYNDWGNPIGYPDNVNLDAVNGPNGRPAGGAMHPVTTNFGLSVRLYAVYERGTKRFRLTRKMTLDALKEFKKFIEKEGGCKCKNYFGVN